MTCCPPARRGQRLRPGHKRQVRRSTAARGPEGGRRRRRSGGGRGDPRVACTRGGASLDRPALARPPLLVSATGGGRTLRDAELEAGAVRQLVFALPGGVGWPLPLYELALLTATFLAQRAIERVELTLVTP